MENFAVKVYFWSGTMIISLARYYREMVFMLTIISPIFVQKLYFSPNLYLRLVPCAVQRNVCIEFLCIYDWPDYQLLLGIIWLLKKQHFHMYVCTHSRCCSQNGSCYLRAKTPICITMYLSLSVISVPIT